MKSYDVTIQMKALCLYLQMVLFFFSKFHNINLVEICFRLNLAVKGLKTTFHIPREYREVHNSLFKQFLKLNQVLQNEMR